MTEMTGQRISAMGVWNVIQSLGDKVCEEERELVKAHKSGQIKGEKEARIAQTYNLDETEIRIMNADGAEWVENICDAETIFQLDPFHRNKAINKNIPYPKAVNAIHEMLNKLDLDGVFEYLATYKNSLDEDEEIEKANKLITYFRNNREGLIPYKEKELKLPENKQGLEYRNMGTMENHVWSIIARRMKHNHSCWSIKCGNNLAKILAKKCSGKLNEVAAKLKMPVFEESIVQKIESDILMPGSKSKHTSGMGIFCRYIRRNKVGGLNVYDCQKELPNIGFLCNKYRANDYLTEASREVADDFNK